MRAIECLSPGELRLVSRPEPEPSPGEVLLRIRRVGVCGTDFHIYKGDQPFVAYPRIMGHELAAEVVANNGSGPLKPGDLVCVLPYIACGECIACRRGKRNCCVNIAVLGVHSDGGLAEFLCVPERCAVKADGVGLDALAMTEFLSIGLHAVRRAGIEGGERALIVGAGPIGLGAALFAELSGAEITIVDVSDRRLAACRDILPSAHTLHAGDALSSRLAALTDGNFFDVVFDATGNRAAMEKGFQYVAHGGAYVLISIVQGDIAFNDAEFHKRETTLFASRNATREDFEDVLSTMRAGRIRLDLLNTHKSTLEDLPKALPQWLSPEAGVIKAIVEV